jgi:thiamine pyrophosphokinase
MCFGVYLYFESTQIKRVQEVVLLGGFGERNDSLFAPFTGLVAHLTNQQDKSQNTMCTGDDGNCQLLRKRSACLRISFSEVQQT